MRTCGFILCLGALVAINPAAFADPVPSAISVRETSTEILLTRKAIETLEVRILKAGGLYRSPVSIRVDGQPISFNGFYVHIDGMESGFEVESTTCSLQDDRVLVAQRLRHPSLNSPTHLLFRIWMEPNDSALRIQVEMNGKGQHLDLLGIEDHQGDRLAATRMYLGRMYVLDYPQAFEIEHNYNTCKFWCWTLENGITELQATRGPAKKFRFDPEKGRYDLSTYCESPVDYLFFFTRRSPQEAIAEYRGAIDIPAPSTLSQLPGRVGVMAAYPIAERYEDFLEEWTGKGARDFVWLAYHPAPGDRDRVEKFGALYAVYDIYLDAFKEGPRKMEGWTPDMVQYRHTGKMVRGYWGSSWLLPHLYVQAATTRVMGVLGREFRNDQGENDFVASSATRYSNLAITKTETRPSGLYLDVHASKAPHHYFDSKAGHHGAWEQMRGEKALFDFARDYLGNVPIWSEGGGEDYVGLMDGGWFMDWRPPEEIGVHAAKWQYYPLIDQVHRERLLNMGIYYPLDRYDPEMVNAAILFGRPQAISVYYGTSQKDVSGRLKVYYLTKAFHRMLGLSRMDRIDFQDDDIDRCVVSYSNGARVWSNRSGQPWDVEDLRVPPSGWVIRGPGGFLEFRAQIDGGTVEVVRSDEYDFYSSSEKRTDFGPVTCDGALAIARSGPNRILIYEIQKPTGAFELKLDQIPGVGSGRRAMKVDALLTRGRRLPLEFPDFRQRPDSANPAVPGNLLEIRPVEMEQTLGYEVALEEKLKEAK